MPATTDRSPGFLWGAATSAYQIEGGVDADGRGPSIWDVFARRSGAVRGGDTAEVATDHYHRWEEDLDLLDWLGVGAYRLSVAWPRIQPTGRGPANTPGLDFYDRLVDGLLERDIEPVVTLYHWDLPQALQDGGGWAARTTAGRFADYTGIVARRLGDRVRWWVTLNEPWCQAFLGYRTGVHAPGITDDTQAVAAAHHLLLAHGRAAALLQENLPAGAQVGIALNLHPVRAASGRDADRRAAGLVDGGRNRAWLDPILRGRYPEDVLADWARVADLTALRDGDLAEIATPIDWLGINYYYPVTVSGGHAGAGEVAEPGSAGIVHADPPGPRTALGWPIDPAGLTEVVQRVTADYGPVPLMVTENGAACDDAVGPDGVVNDRDRIAFLDAHVREVRGLVAAGTDLRGYLVWTLLDNFEWAEGYRGRFGLVHVDRRTLARTPKLSARWYRDLVAAGAPGAAEGGA